MSQVFYYFSTFIQHQANTAFHKITGLLNSSPLHKPFRLKNQNQHPHKTDNKI